MTQVHRSHGFTTVRIALGILSALLWTSPADSATLHVAADGSAPYADLASAAAVAASGDTIRIAGGEYPDVATYTLDDGHTFQAVVYVEVPELTIIGESRDTVLLGPESPLPNMEHAPLGINQVATTATRLVVRGVTVRNTSFGIAIFDDGEVTESRFEHNFHGVDSQGKTRTVVANCEFVDNTNRGVIVFQTAAPNSVGVLDCQFRNNQTGVSLQSLGSLVDNCDFSGGLVGMQVSFGGSATVRDCTFLDNQFVGVNIPFGCTGTLLDNEFYGVSEGNIANDGTLQGSGNVLSGGTFTTIQLSTRATYDFHGNHILNAGGYSTWLSPGGFDPVIPIDLTNNHWGTEDPAQIDAWILDHNDDDRIKGEVLFAPFFPRPIPTESTSFGELKSRYRH